MSTLRLKFCAIACLLFMAPASAFSEYLFTAPPRETRERGMEIYKPICFETMMRMISFVPA